MKRISIMIMAVLLLLSGLYNVTAQTADNEMPEYREGISADAKSDYATAMQWYLKAAAKGNVAAMRQIGEMYRHGQGVSNDAAKALEWYLKAVDTNGDPEAMDEIAGLYTLGPLAGPGVPEDDVKAIEWYKKAIEHGYKYPESSMYMIAVIYEGMREYDKAREWYIKAKEAGHKDAEEGLEGLDNLVLIGYEVTADPTLNVRSGPGAEHQLLGTLTKGIIISVKSFSGDWAEITYKEQPGYVNKQYLKEYLMPAKRGRSSDDNYRMAEILLYVVLALAILTWIMVRWGTAGFILSIFTAIAISAIELVFFLVLKQRVWFCDPDSVGWGWTIVNFFLFMFVALTQFIVIRNSIGLMFQAACYFPLANSGKVMLIILAALVGVPLYGILFASSSESYLLGMLVTIMALFLAVQIIMIIIHEKEAPGWTLLLCVLATVGLVVLFAGFIITLIKFLFVLIMAVIAVIGLMIAGKVTGSSGGSGDATMYEPPSSSQSEQPDEPVKEKDKIYEDRDGNRYRRANWGKHRGDDGHNYDAIP